MSRHALRLVGLLSVVAIVTAGLAAAAWQVTADTRLELTRATSAATPAHGRSLTTDLTRTLERELEQPAPRATAQGRSPSLQRDTRPAADDPRAGRSAGTPAPAGGWDGGVVLAPVSAFLVLLGGALVGRLVLRRFGPAGPDEADDVLPSEPDAQLDDDGDADDADDQTDPADDADPADQTDTDELLVEAEAPGPERAEDAEDAEDAVSSGAADDETRAVADGHDDSSARERAELQDLTTAPSTSAGLDAGAAPRPVPVGEASADHRPLWPTVERYQRGAPVALAPPEPAVRERIFERRRAPRVDYVVPGWLEWQGRTWSMTTVDLSEQGLGCRLEPLGDGETGPGQREQVRVHLPLAGGTAELSAQVAWRSVGADGVTLGLLFRLLSEQEASDISRTCFAGVPVTA